MLGVSYHMAAKPTFLRFLFFARRPPSGVLGMEGFAPMAHVLGAYVRRPEP